MVRSPSPISENATIRTLINGYLQVYAAHGSISKNAQQDVVLYHIPGNRMFKFIFLLCLLALVAFCAQVLYLHQDTALSWHVIKGNPDWLLWGTLVLAAPVLFFSYMLLQWWSQKREAHKIKLGHQRSHVKS
jgi:Zn-dependent protease with chaperone function